MMDVVEDKISQYKEGLKITLIYSGFESCLNDSVKSKFF